MNHIEEPRLPGKPRQSHPDLSAPEAVDPRVNNIKELVGDSIHETLNGKMQEKLINAVVDKFVAEDDILIESWDKTDDKDEKNQVHILVEIKYYLLVTAKQRGWDQKMINYAAQQVIVKVENYIIHERSVSSGIISNPLYRQRLSHIMQEAVENLYDSKYINPKNGTTGSTPSQT